MAATVFSPRRESSREANARRQERLRVERKAGSALIHRRPSGWCFVFEPWSMGGGRGGADMTDRSRPSDHDIACIAPFGTGA
jgi:hypothetical protein